MSGINVSEIKEWHIELRDNEVSMGEENVKAKKKKLDHEEQTLEEQVDGFIQGVSSLPASETPSLGVTLSPKRDTLSPKTSSQQPYS